MSFALEAAVSTADEKKTKAQLIAELRALRAELVSEAVDDDPETTGRPVLVQDVRLSQVLLEVNPDLIFMLDGDGRILDYRVSADSPEPFVPPSVFLGRTVGELMPQLAERIEHSLSLALETGAVQTVEYELPVAGRQRFFESRIVVYRGELLIALVRDVSERRAVEEALQASEQKYRLLFDAAKDAMVLVDAETLEIFDANAAAIELYGYDRERLLTMKALDLSARPDASREMIQRTLKAAPERLELHQNLHRRQDGSVFHVDIAGAPVEVSGRRAIFAVFRDISAHVEAARALAESRGRFRELAEHIRDVFWLFDWVEQKVLYVSPTYEEVWGRKASDLYERYQDWGESIHPDDQPGAAESFDRIVETGGGELREYRIVRPGGEVRWVADRGYAIRDDAGRVVRIAGLAEDVTERKEQEEERDALIAELERANAELERFVYTVSHDLKSPLITIKGFSECVVRDIEDGDVALARADLDRIFTAAEDMRQLLDGLLSLSRVGRVVNISENVPLAGLAEEIVARMSERLAQGGVTVSVDSALPTVFGDRVRLREVLENLISNSLVCFGEQPKPRIEIGLRAAEVDDEGPVVFVRDNGIGIEPPYHEKVFGLFQKLSPSSPGSGIGLAIVKRIVESHGGRIWVESEGSGKGTTLCFTLASAEPAPARR